MPWEKPKFEKLAVNSAGITLSENLIDDIPNDNALKDAFKVLQNFRLAHAYPMQVFLMTLKNKAKLIDSNAIAAQRLKRIPAILEKLNRSYHGRKPSMKLYQMQDIGGCRAVVDNVELAKKLWLNHYNKNVNFKHDKVRVDDYITNPKSDGYRSIHVIYAYKSDKQRKKCFNGLKVEIQIRSHLQHIWATAVESIDFFTRQSMKTSKGDPKWTKFFMLVSSAFAKMEKCPLVPGTPTDKVELYKEIIELEKELQVIDKLSGFTHAMKFYADKVKSKSPVKYFLLELDIRGKNLKVTYFTRKNELEAIEAYNRLEEKHRGNNEYDVVLVGTNSISELKKAYPNYYVDSEEFIEKILSIKRSLRYYDKEKKTLKNHKLVEFGFGPVN